MFKALVPRLSVENRLADRHLVDTHSIMKRHFFGKSIFVQMKEKTRQCISQMSVDQISVDQMPVCQMYVSKMSVGKCRPAKCLPAKFLLVSYMSFGQKSGKSL